MIKKLALLAAISPAAQALASFDLALVLQNYAVQGGPTQAIITRWDPINRLSLGVITTPGFDSSTKLILNPSTPGVVTGARLSSGTLSLTAYNYSTGLLHSYSTVSITGTSLTSAKMLSGGTMLLTGANNASPFARLFTSTGALIRSYVLPSGTVEVHDAMIGADGIVHVLSRQTGTSAAFKTTLTSYAANSSAIAASVVIADNTSSPYPSLVRNGTTIAVCGTSNWQRYAVNTSGTSLGTPNLVNGLFTPTAKTVNGHGATIHGFGYISNLSRMTITTSLIDSPIGTTYFDVEGGVYGNIFDAVVVVAPEPGTLIAIGVGSAALLKRRKKRAA